MANWEKWLFLGAVYTEADLKKKKKKALEDIYKKYTYNYNSVFQNFIFYSGLMGGFFLFFLCCLQLENFFVCVTAIMAFSCFYKMDVKDGESSEMRVKPLSGKINIKTSKKRQIN